MNASEILQAFALPPDGVLEDAFISDNPNLMELAQPVDWMCIVPVYVAWVLRHRESEGNLVCDWTMNALAEFGRAKDPGNATLNFKFLCSPAQRLVIVRFLSWSCANLQFVDERQIDRAIVQWQRTPEVPMG